MDGGEYEHEEDHALTDLGAPNCPIDLMPMELDGTTAALAMPGVRAREG
jgi:hypothetical protein